MLIERDDGDHLKSLALKILSNNGTSGAARTNTQISVLYFHLNTAR